MKVAVVLGTFPKRSERFIARELAALVRLGLELRVFALSAGDPELLSEEPFRSLAPLAEPLPHFLSPRALASTRTAAARPVRTLGLLPDAVSAGLSDPRGLAALLPRLSWAPALARAAERAGCSLIWAHFASTPGAVGFMAARLSGLPFALSCHAWDIFVNRALVAAQIEEARLVLACSRAARAHLLGRWNAPPGKVELVYHGVPEPPPSDAAERRPRAGGNFRVLGIGRLVAKKGFRHLVEAAALSKRGFAVELAGEGPERGALLRLLGERRLANHVTLGGELDAAGLAAAYERADAICSPSVVAPDGDRDGVPNSLLEAMAAGLPAIAADAGGLPEAVEDGRTGLVVPPADPAALSRAVERLAADPALCARLAAGAREMLRARFSLEKNAARLRKLLLVAAGQDT